MNPHWHCSSHCFHRETLQNYRHWGGLFGRTFQRTFFSSMRFSCRWLISVWSTWTQGPHCSLVLPFDLARASGCSAMNSWKVNELVFTRSGSRFPPFTHSQTGRTKWWGSIGPFVLLSRLCQHECTNRPEQSIKYAWNVLVSQWQSANLILILLMKMSLMWDKYSHSTLF